MDFQRGEYGLGSDLPAGGPLKGLANHVVWRTYCCPPRGKPSRHAVTIDGQDR